MIEDPLRCLEAVLQCYELLSPLIAHRIFNEATVFVREQLNCQLALLKLCLIIKQMLKIVCFLFFIHWDLDVSIPYFNTFMMINNFFTYD